MVSAHVVTVTADGRIPLPAETLARWRSDRVLAVDLWNRVVLRPLPDDPVGALRGKYRGRGPSTMEARADCRQQDASPATDE